MNKGFSRSRMAVLKNIANDVFRKFSDPNSMEKDPLYEKVIEVEQLLLDVRALIEVLVAATEVSRDEWLDNQEVMQRFKMSERTLKRRRRDGTFPFKKIKGKCYYRLSDIMLAFTDRPSEK